MRIVNFTIGIDPGYTGAIVIFKKDMPLAVYDMPVLKIGNKKELDENDLADIIKEYSEHILTTGWHTTQPFIF